MQVNPVHALLQILKTEAQKGRPVKPLDVQEGGAPADPTFSHTGGPAPRAVESVWHLGVPRGGSDHEPHAGNSGGLEELGSRLATRTSDAINRSSQEANGRSWNYTAEKDAPKTMSHGDASASTSATNPTVVGVALPFTPSREDIRHALLSGDGWPEDWGEELRARLLREEALQEPEPAFELGFQAIVLIAVLIAAFIITII